MRVLITFQRGQPAGGGYYTASQSASMNVVPPDNVELLNNPPVLNVNVPVVAGPPPNLDVVFQMKKGNRRLFYVGGAPVERLDRGKYGKEPDHDWSEPVPFMSVDSSNAQIHDGKGVVGDEAFVNGFPVGAVLDEFDQYLGIRLLNGCDEYEEIHFPNGFHFQVIKVNDTSWKLVIP